MQFGTSSRCIVPLTAHFRCVFVHICLFSYTRLPCFPSRSWLSRSCFRWRNMGEILLSDFLFVSVRFHRYAPTVRLTPRRPISATVTYNHVTH
jgi:hypothetical protein